MNENVECCYMWIHILVLVNYKYCKHEQCHLKFLLDCELKIEGYDNYIGKFLFLVTHRFFVLFFFTFVVSFIGFILSCIVSLISSLFYWKSCGDMFGMAYVWL